MRMKFLTEIFFIFGIVNHKNEAKYRFFCSYRVVTNLTAHF